MRALLVVTGLALWACSTAAPRAHAPRRVRHDVEAVSGLGLFRDERERARALLAAALERQGVAVAPAEVEQAWALAAEGRHPLTGQVCGRPLVRDEARRRWAASVGVEASVSASVFCEADGGCELSVYGHPLHDEGESVRLVAPIARDGSPLVALEEALAHVAAPPPSEGRGGLGVGGLGSRGVQREDRLRVVASPADRRRRADAPEPPLTGLSLEQVSACLGAGDEVASLLVEVRDGLVSRCEGSEDEAASVAGCACALLARARLSDGLAAGRWRLSLQRTRSDSMTLDGALVLRGSWRKHLERHQAPGAKRPTFRPKVEHPSLEDWKTPPAPLTGACFAGAFHTAGDLATRWAVWFDTRGRPARIVEQKRYPPLPPAVAACVARSLELAQAPCPARGDLWAMADFTIEARDPSAPAKPLFRASPSAADGGVTGW
ncbi:MAG: hypothetical protein INH41_03455 [Myxococcaceae bacterium]|nr:hypothetical protein [Myxococcaceae bacterium]MCA3011436.1 hypothetical protein [Myxococcaceae bacterium]